MMAPVIALTPALQRFDWGSSQGIPDLMGFAPDGGPYAEAWWGAHPSAPSVTAAGPLDDKTMRLVKLGVAVVDRSLQPHQH